MAKIDPLIALAIPTWGKVSITWARALRHIGGPLGSNMVELSPVVGKPIAEARNELMEAAIANNCDFIFFLGDDTLPEGDALIRLLQRMWDNPEIGMVTGMYWTKHWPTQPYIWKGVQRGPYMDWKYGEFFEVDFAGCDCLLVRLSPEMKALGPEWFATDWLWDEDQAMPSLLATEDFYFYTKARKAGIKVWCDSLVQCIHEDRNSGIQYGLTHEMPQYSGKDVLLPEAKTDAAPLVKLADIGAGYDAPFFGHADQVKVVRFDANEKVLPDFRCDIRHLPVPDQSFDVVHSRHVLEHFGRKEVTKVMKEWSRILRIGGEFRLSVPNLLSAMKNVLLMEEGIIAVHPYPFWQLYGRQEDEYDVHKNGWTPRRLRLLFESLGIFEDINVEVRGGPDDDLNIFVTARKAKHLKPHALLPDWDVIQEAEKIVVAGLAKEPAVKVPRKRNGTKPEPEPVLARSQKPHWETPEGHEPRIVG